MFPFFYDPYFFLILIGMGLSALASMLVQSTFSRYSNVLSQSNLTGEQAAQAILADQAIHNVTVHAIAGNLTDNYNGQNKTLNLSEATFNQTSVAAIGVAAHEVGHAIQDAQNYVPMRLRARIVPVANLGASLSMPLILLGIFLGMNQMLINIGILAFAAVLVFQVVTLPVEFDASRRAIASLRNQNLLTETELSAVKKVLTAAAFTYIASALSTFLQLLRLVLLFSNRNND
ncbi:zinc metallopeptidase [Holzapfeliella sp. He02]|uniref:Zinc metallopeptidase n=1 Tax=Holzapfeliella saturejae TaxID=3082953 RepID=A0ABU8SF38_9LACO